MAISHITIQRGQFPFFHLTILNQNPDVNPYISIGSGSS